MDEKSGLIRSIDSMGFLALVPEFFVLGTCHVTCKQIFVKLRFCCSILHQTGRAFKPQKLKSNLIMAEAEKKNKMPQRFRGIHCWERNISPQNGIFEDDFPFPKVGYVSSLEGKLLLASFSCKIDQLCYHDLFFWIHDCGLMVLQVVNNDS